MNSDWRDLSLKENIDDTDFTKDKFGNFNPNHWQKILIFIGKKDISQKRTF